MNGFEVISTKTAQIPQFPGNANTAERHYQAWLNKMLEEGKELVSIFSTNVGTEMVWMFVFKVGEKPPDTANSVNKVNPKQGDLKHKAQPPVMSEKAEEINSRASSTVNAGKPKTV